MWAPPSGLHCSSLAPRFIPVRGRINCSLIRGGITSYGLLTPAAPSAERPLSPSESETDACPRKMVQMKDIQSEYQKAKNKWALFLSCVSIFYSHFRVRMNVDLTSGQVGYIKCCLLKIALTTGLFCKWQGVMCGWAKFSIRHSLQTANRNISLKLLQASQSL